MQHLKLPIPTYYLLLGQACNLISAVLSVTVSAIVGEQLAPSVSMATIPYGLQFLAILLFTYICSNLMKTYGRYIMFQAGAIFLILAGSLGYLSMTHHNFLLLCMSHFLLGLFTSCANFYRFAATDHISNKQLLTKASSIVISGGMIAAIVAPWIASQLQSVPPYANYSLCYAFLIPLGLFVSAINLLWHHTQPNTPSQSQPTTSIQQTKQNLASYHISVAILASSIGYFLMNLMMIQFSIVLKNHHSFSASSHAIQMHVLAMFTPSFFAPFLIRHIHISRYILLGFLLIAASSLLVLHDHRLMIMNVSMILLGIGWNFTFTGGSSLIASIHQNNKHKIQGMNDTCIALFATLGAFAPAYFLSNLGWAMSNYLCITACILSIVLIILLQKLHDRAQV